MFIQNKYCRWYMRIVSAPDEGGGTERHHIVPKSLKGGNEPDNVVRLSFRKHFLCHWLLTKFTAGPDQKRMMKALGCMVGNRKKTIASWQYVIARHAGRQGQLGCPSAMKGKKTSEETREKQRAAALGRRSPMRGRAASPETRQRLRESHLGKSPSEETRRKMSAASRGNKRRAGAIATDETRAKLSAALMGNQRTLGRKHSAETRKRMSDSQRARLARENAAVAQST